MLDGRVIRSVCCDSQVFAKTLGRIKDQRVVEEIKEHVRLLLMCDLDAPPRKLHLHQLTNKKVASVLREGHQVTPWTIHVTSNDAYKASFTLEDGTAHLRKVDEHDAVDKNP